MRLAPELPDLEFQPAPEDPTTFQCLRCRYYYCARSASFPPWSGSCRCGAPWEAGVPAERWAAVRSAIGLRVAAVVGDTHDPERVWAAQLWLLVTGGEEAGL